LVDDSEEEADGPAASVSALISELFYARRPTAPSEKYG